MGSPSAKDAVMSDKPQCRPKNLDKYPYCVPSYDFAVLEGRNIELWLKDKRCFGVTHCDVFEAIEGQCAWKLDINEMGLQAYLQVLPPSPIYLFLSGLFLRSKKYRATKSPRSRVPFERCKYCFVPRNGIFI